MYAIHTNLAHQIDESLLRRAFYQLRRDGAVGIDGVSWQAYERDLAENLQDLHERLKHQKYRATPLRRVEIPKEDGTQRAIHITILEDKLVQKAVVVLLEPIFEEDFLEVSYGFRARKGPQRALASLRKQLMNEQLEWVIDLDIRKYFDTVPHHQLQEFIHRRVKDKGMDRLIGKWLKTGALEEGNISSPHTGVPQGSVISPLLSNIYLHYVLDEWFEETVKPRMRENVAMIRFADDMVIGCQSQSDALRLMEVLSKRLKRFGLSLHPEKSRLVRFNRPWRGEAKRQDNGTFDFLGFTHYWGKTHQGGWIVMRRTMKSRLNRTKLRIKQWCRMNRHLPLEEQRQILAAQLRGHYQYFGVRGNFASLHNVYWHATATWRKWLGERSQKGWITWEAFLRLLEHYPLPKPRIIHTF